MQSGEPGGSFLAGGEGALAQHVLLHDRCPIRLGRSICWNRRQQCLQLLEHQGLAGVGAAVGHPEAQRCQVTLGICGLRGLGAGTTGGHVAEGLGWPGRALVEAAPRVGAHAAQQRSCSSLAPGIGWRSLASDGITASVTTMRWMHSFGLDLTDRWRGAEPRELHQSVSRRSTRGVTAEPPHIPPLSPALSLHWASAASCPRGSGRPGPGRSSCRARS